jgi:N-acetylmuramoyl-L-alanine amidase
MCLLLLLLGHLLRVQAVLAARDGFGRRSVIVLDPGHGGADQGAVGPSGLTEKAVTLSIARGIRERLSRAFTVYLTRDDDYEVDVVRRTEFANHHRADLFVSIHAGGTFQEARGRAVVFYQGLQQGIGSTPPSRGSNSWNMPKEPLPWTDLWVKHDAQNRLLAEIMHRRLLGKNNPESEVVHQAPVLVLEGADMPAVLVEIGSLTHPAEEASLKKDEGISAAANAISEAIEEFVRRHP